MSSFKTYKIFINTVNDKRAIYSELRESIQGLYYTKETHLTAQYLNQNNLSYFDCIEVIHRRGVIVSKRRMNKVITPQIDITQSAVVQRLTVVDDSVNMKLKMFIADIENDLHEILMIGYTVIVVDFEGRIDILETGCFHTDKENSEGTYCGDDEGQMVDDFYDKINTVNPAYVVGHNFERFDKIKIERVGVGFGDRMIYDTLVWSFTST